MTRCLYVDGSCNHSTCWEYRHGPMPEHGPTEADYCAQGGHGYYDDDTQEGEHGVETLGRCWCGARTYPPGGPVTDVTIDISNETWA